MTEEGEFWCLLKGRWKVFCLSILLLLLLFPHPAWPLVDGALLVSKRRSPAPDDLLTFVRPLCRPLYLCCVVFGCLWYTGVRLRFLVFVGVCRSAGLFWRLPGLAYVFSVVAWRDIWSSVSAKSFLCCQFTAAQNLSLPAPR